MRRSGRRGTAHTSGSSGLATGSEGQAVGVDGPEPVGLVGHAHVVRPVVGTQTAVDVSGRHHEVDLLVLRHHFGSRFVSLGVGL